MTWPDLTPAKRRAREQLAHGDERAGARSHFRAMGIDPDRLEQPIVGIASTWTHTMPCNLNHRDLQDAVAAGVEQAGGVPLSFNTIAVSDNQSQATPGMRASLVSRRADRGLDRADGHRARLRRAGVHRRLRQDGAGGA